MKKRYSITFILLFVLSTCAIAQDKIQSDTLRDAFLTRPLDVIKEDIRWNITTTDLYTAWISNGLYGMYGKQPQIMLNGMPLNANFFGWQDLNMLPLFVNNMDQAASHFAPGTYKLTPSGSGVINLKTGPLPNGFTAKAMYFTGNETKDPGPWAYDSLKMSPNIDRWGPDKGLMLGYKANHWYAKAIYMNRFHKPRDLAQNIRLHFTNSFLGTNTEYTNHLISIESTSALFKAGVLTDKWSLSSRYVLSENNDYLFLQPFAREIPVTMEYHQWAIQTKYQTDSWFLKARYLLDQKSLHRQFDLHPYIFNWDQTNHTVTVAGGYKSRHIKITPGVAFKRYHIEAPGINNRNHQLVTYFIKSDIDFGYRFKLYLNTYLDHYRDIGAKSFTIKGGAITKVSPHYTIQPELLYAEQNPLRQHSFAYWTNRGYTFANRLNIAFDFPVSVRENEVLSLKLKNNVHLGDFRLKVVPQFIKNYRLNIPWQKVQYQRVTNTLPGQFTVSQHSGERFKLLASFSYAFQSAFNHALSLKHSFTIYLQQTINGSRRYKQYFKQVPNTTIKYQFDITPVKSLRISVNATYRSSTTWNELAAIDGKPYMLPAGIPLGDIKDTFNTTTPSFINLNVGISKWLFDHHLNLKVGMQNILDQEVRYHPMGASLYPKFNFKALLQF